MTNSTYVSINGLQVSRFWLDLVAGRIVIDADDWYNRSKAYRRSNEGMVHLFPWERYPDE